MSYNSNFCNNFSPNMYTFQGNYAPVPPCNFSMPPPPIPPPVFIAPWVAPQQSDQDFVRSFENGLQSSYEKKPKIVSISEARERITQLVLTYEEIKKMENMLRENLETISNEEWNVKMQEVANKKMTIESTLFSMGDSYLDQLKKLLTKRFSKRLRLKRVKVEQMREKAEQTKLLQERSRKIDENLKKIQDDILKAKQEAEAKLDADAVLREVLRKKSDAKKCIAKLDGLLDLRRARMNTVKGRGDTANENEMTAFKNNIDKLKLLWTQKLTIYEKEESDLRNTLKQSTEQMDALSKTDNDILENLKGWRQLLFGHCLPQVNFKGDVQKFVTIRTQWDKYVCSEGTSLPMGWVIPKMDD